MEVVTDDKNYDVPLLVGIETTSTITNQKLKCDNQDLLEKFLEILKNLKNNDMLKDVVRIENNESIFLYTNAGHAVNIGDISDLNYKLMRLKSIIVKDKMVKSYIDVSNINVWPVSKPLWD